MSKRRPAESNLDRLVHERVRLGRMRGHGGGGALEDQLLDVALSRGRPPTVRLT